MKKFEYMVLVYDHSDYYGDPSDDMSKDLDLNGADGWELVSATCWQGFTRLFLKREVKK